MASAPPAVTTEPAAEVTKHEATLKATVNPEGLETTYQFEYTTAKDFQENGYEGATSAPASPEGIGSGTEGVEVVQTIEGLEPKTRYRFRVVASNSEGTTYGNPIYKSSFGKEGTGNGEFKYIGDVAIAPDGTLWVVDIQNNRLQHFSAGGGYLGASAKVESPDAVAINSAGEIYVSGNYVKKLNSKGEVTATLASYGSSEGQVRFAVGLDLDSEGNLWVADSENGRVDKFNTKGEFVKSIGGLSSPWGVSVAPGGNLWVAEHGAHRISVLSPAGELLNRFGSKGSEPGQFEELSDVEVADGYAWVGDAENNRVQLFNEEGEYVTSFGKEGTGEGQFHTRSWIRVAVAPNGDVWVTDSGNDRVERWNAGSFETSPYTPIYKSSFGKEGTGNGEFKYIGDVAIAPDGTLWVVDIQNNRLQHFSADGGYLGASAKVESPDAVAINSAGEIYVSGNYVKKLNSKGEVTATLASYGSSEGQVRFAVGLDLDSEGNLWVADSENGRVDKFNTKGEFVKSIGGLSSPWGVSVAPGGNLWVAEHGAHRISVLSPAGELLNRFGSKGSEPGQFEELSDVEVADGYAWVGDAENNRVQLFNEEGEYVTSFGKEGTGEGQFHTRSWIRVAVAPNGDVWVTDSGNDRVERWIYGALATATTEPATEVSQREATLNATVNPEGLETSYQFQYTTAEDFEEHGYENATSVPASPEGIGSGTKDVEVSESIEGIEPDTTYHFRVVAENGLGASKGEDKTFTTPEATLKKPIAAYSFDNEFEEGETAYDDVGSHNGTVEGAEWTQGRKGDALRFDGENDVVTIPDSSSLDLHESFTLEAWVDPSESHNWAPVIAKDDSGKGMPFGYVLYGQGGGEAPVGSVAKDESTKKTVSGASALPQEEWSQLALTSDGTQMRLYVNGKLTGTESSVPAKITDGALQIGGSTTLGQYFAGRIDEVRIYSEVLSGKEIRNSLDLSPPQAELSGPLFESADGPLGVESASMTINAGDGSGEVASGLKNVEIRVDGKLAEVISCGCGEPITFTYSKKAWGSGANTVAVTVNDKAGNQTVRELTVDKPDGPSIALEGPLYERRGTTIGAKAHKLTIHVGQTDSSEAAPRPGVKSIEVKVDGTLAGEPKTQTCPEGNCSLETTWIFEPTSYAEGTHTIAVIAKDQQGNTTTRSFEVEIDTSDPCGNSAEEPVEGCEDATYPIQHATSYVSEPGTTKEFVAEEWIQPGTPNARKETAKEYLWTRDVVPCPEEPEAECGEVRTISPGVLEETNELFVTTSSDPNDDQLDPVAELNAFDPSALGEPTKTGPLVDALASWQSPPPNHGSTYALYSEIEEVAEGPTLKTLWWVDASTDLPLRRVSVIEEESHVVSEKRELFDFDQTPPTPESLPENFFDSSTPEEVVTEVTRSLDEPLPEPEIVEVDEEEEAGEF